MATFGANLDEAQLKKLGLDPTLITLMGARPQYESIVDSSGNLLPGFSNLAEFDTRSSGINVNKDALNMLRTRATSTGLSPWAQMMLDRQGIEEATAMDRAAANSNTAAATARSALARSGGLSAGARERIAKNAGRELMTSRANVGRQGQVDRLALMAEDDKTKLDLMKAMPGLELQGIQPEMEKLNAWSRLASDDTRSRLADREMKLKNDLAGYTEIMQAYGADRTARAQEEGKK